MNHPYIRPFNERILVVTGHYGSGKTEFAVSLALLLAGERVRAFPRLALADMDIANPYFRSRERRGLLESAGVSVHGSVYRQEITAELPALSASVRAPLEDKGCLVIVDAGGNDSGALVLNQFGKYFTTDETAVLAVVNFNRFETRDIASAAAHMDAIESVTGLRAGGIVNNTHLLMETTAETIARGHRLSAGLCDGTGRRLWCDCYPERLVDRAELIGLSGYLMPLGLHMRPTWLDR